MPNFMISEEGREVADACFTSSARMAKRVVAGQLLLAWLEHGEPFALTEAFEQARQMLESDGVDGRDGVAVTKL